jgi:hypothetical protein
MFVGAMAVQTAALPSEINDKDFWRMIVDLSEPGGTYPYENFVSNELQYQDVVPALKATTKPGGVYIGVGPEQNFTYTAVLQSKLAFVIDIRRQNMIEHLMYKALIEASNDRADFLSRLFSRQQDFFWPLIAWLGAAAVLLLVGLLTARPFELDHTTGEIKRSGSWVPLIRNVTVFALQYTVAVIAAVDPHDATTAAIVGRAISGGTTGYFLGGTIALLRQYWKQRKADIKADLTT